MLGKVIRLKIDNFFIYRHSRRTTLRPVFWVANQKGESFRSASLPFDVCMLTKDEEQLSLSREIGETRFSLLAKALQRELAKVLQREWRRQTK